MYELKCDCCGREEERLMKWDELPTATESKEPCTENFLKCIGFMYRKLSSPGRININGVDHAGDGSKVHRFEMISKNVEELDIKASQREGRTILKDSK